MPELPEVETMVRGIRPHVEGGTIESLGDCPCPCRPLSISPPLPQMARRVQGEQISTVRRLAKRIVLQIATGDAIVIEPRMTGLMLVADPPDREHLRVQWQLRCGRRRQGLWFWDRRGLGTIRLLNTHELLELEQGGRLGCDPLGLSPLEWQARLGAVRRPVKVALLDQSLIAGIGNLYASEILHLARIHPEHRTETLTSSHFARLQTAADQILQTAIQYEGSTLSDGTYRNALNKSGGYQNAHRVYDREGNSCPTCRRGRIRRIVQAQRSTFFCPVCQRPPRGRAARLSERQS